ncbi:MAG: M16 family metallopeptidase, partial [Dehalococcoidia bacterium]
GYALDSRWYGIGAFTDTMRIRLSALSADEVNAAIRRHLSPSDLSVVIVARDAEALRDELLAARPATIRYDAEKPADLLADDREIGAVDLRLTAEQIRITPVEEVFAR